MSGAFSSASDGSVEEPRAEVVVDIVAVAVVVAATAARAMVAAGLEPSMVAREAGWGAGAIEDVEANVVGCTVCAAVVVVVVVVVVIVVVVVLKSLE